MASDSSLYNIMEQVLRNIFFQVVLQQLTISDGAFFQLIYFLGKLKPSLKKFNTIIEEEIQKGHEYQGDNIFV